MTSTEEITVIDVGEKEGAKMSQNTEMSENVFKITSTEEIKLIDVGEKECEKISQNSEMSENIPEQQEISKTSTEDLAEQVVPCAEARQEEAEEKVPETDLFTERESEENTAETLSKEKLEEEVATEEKQVEKEAKEEEEDDENDDDGSGEKDVDDGEEETEKEPKATQGKKKMALREPKKDNSSRMNLNNEVVLMRKEVSRVRGLLIRKLTRQIAALKKKKGKENEVQKNQRRAERMVEEIHEMKALKPDVVTKIALQQEIQFDVVCRNPASSVTDRAIARIASHPQFSKRIATIKLAVKAFREERSKKGRGKPKIADADELTQRKKMEEEEESKEQEMVGCEEKEEIGGDGSEVTTTQNRDLSGVSGSRKIGKVTEPLKKGMPRNRKSAVNKTQQSKVMEKKTNHTTAKEKTVAMEDDTGKSCLEKCKVVFHIKSPPPSEGAKAMDDASHMVVKIDTHSKVTEKKREVTISKQPTASLEGAGEEESDDDAIEVSLHKGSSLSKSDLKVHQGVEEKDDDDDDDDDDEDDDDDSDLQSDEDEESNSMRSPESDNGSEEETSTKYSEAKDLKKPLSKVGYKRPNLKPDLESNQKMSGDDDESDIESSDEEAPKEYFDDSTEERFHKRSSQSESDGDDDFFLGKVSKFKKKKKKTKSGVKDTPSEPESPAELEPRPSDSQGSKFTSVFCQSLSRSESGDGDGDGGRQGFGGRGRGDRFGGSRGMRDGRGRGMRGGGRGGMRGAGRGGFDSRPPRFNSRERGDTGESDFSNAKRDFKSRPFGSKDRGRDFTARGRERESGGGRGRGRGSRLPDRSRAGFNSNQPEGQSLHPSWEASKKRKEQGQIQAFQGKKIRFDDD
ncbi:serum response factor-binding protein 1 isoform X2 [Gadus morhua]|uniref:serum response factor-binding protein 1 isoform X2 n=1 Tax=Gadus morhua TaxID=8049 RepID=UPI0011B5C9F3|nr:serum response factor-binding protein 1 isoform X2 [Gadus morhua]